MPDNNKLCDTILDMEASLSTNLNGYSIWHYGADIHGITRETLKNAVEALKAQEQFMHWLARLVTQEDGEGAECEIICRRLHKMGYVEKYDENDEKYWRAAKRDV